MVSDYVHHLRQLEKFCRRDSMDQPTCRWMAMLYSRIKVVSAALTDLEGSFMQPTV